MYVSGKTPIDTTFEILLNGVMGDTPTAAGWYEHPDGVHQAQAYWDGEKWTGATRWAPLNPYHDPGGASPQPLNDPGWYDDPEGKATHQAYWDGLKWTGATRNKRPPFGPTVRAVVFGFILSAAIGFVSVLIGLDPLVGALLIWVLWAVSSYVLFRVFTRGRQVRFSGRAAALTVLIIWVGGGAALFLSGLSDGGNEPAELTETHAIRFLEGEALEFLGASVSYPEGWDIQRSRIGGLDTVGVTARPEPSSGSSILVSVRSNLRLGDGETSEEWFRSFADSQQEADREITLSPPVDTSHAGLDGISIVVVGLKGNRTGQPLEARMMALFGAHNTYVITLQYELDDETLMQQELDRVLRQLVVPHDEVRADST